MIKLPRNRVACIPIFDSSDSGIKGYDDAKAALGYQKPTSGNIELLDEYKERVDQGIVKYVGAGVTKERYGFGIGDMVIFSGYTGELVSVEGEGLFIILPARFVVAVIIPEPTQISGLFFQDTDGDYWPATYESAIELIAKSLGETSTLKITKDRPRLEDYSEVEDEENE
ncbi:MAG TPA: hypothetical protein ENI23_02080 [bacterium]|nr:hypothetical protein [bacterium]